MDRQARSYGPKPRQVTRRRRGERWFGFTMMVVLVAGSTGCLHHNTRGGCASGACASGGCESGGCQSGSCGGCQGASGGGILGKVKCNVAKRKASGCPSCGSGLLGKVGGLAGFRCKDGNYGGGNCGSCGPGGCGIGPLGRQQGGVNYHSHLNAGLLGHQAAAQLNSQPFVPGPPTGQTAYPYYTVRGPRDFLSAEPPSIGR